MKQSSTVQKKLVYNGKWIDMYLIDFSIGDKINKDYEGICRKT